MGTRLVLTWKSHADSEKILELQLRNIVTDVLIVHQVAIRIGSFVVSNALGYVRLEACQSVIPETF